MIKRIAISGAPGTGKTSIVEELTKGGHICHPEISREIIAQQLKIGGNITPWQDLNSFSKLVISSRLDQYKAARESIEFFDRSIIDSLAYLLKDQLSISKEWDDLAKNNRYYSKVFVTPPWESIYISDSERLEDFETATSIHLNMVKAYEMYDYQVIIVPKISVKERVQFILKHIE